MPNDRERVVVLVAASAADAMTDAAKAFMARYECDVVISAGPSGSQAQQILAGAPADLFLCANVSWAEKVEQAGLSLRRKNLLSNTLVLVTPKGNPAAVQAPADLIQPRIHRVALAAESVPAGMYARQALKSLGILENLIGASRIVEGQDVRATLAYAVAGEVDAAIVYATDAGGQSGVETVYRFAAETHDPIVYPLLLLKNGAGNRSAQAFFDDLLTSESVAAFERRGFLRAEANTTTLDLAGEKP